MIGSFRHRGLKRLYEDDDPGKLTADKVDRLRLILVALDAAICIEDLDIATFRLHPLRGDLRGFWAVTVRANWRIIFRFADSEARDVDLVDYH
jgi:proteic killer suppression protein